MKGSEQRRKDAEARIGHVEAELEKEKHKPPEVKYKYSDKCDWCRKTEYDRKMAEINSKYAEALKDRKSAATELEAAVKIRNYHEEAITERVNKIVKEKTRLERLEQKLKLLWSGFDALFFIVPMLYAIGITIMAIIRNKVVRDDFAEAAVAVGKSFISSFNGIRQLICAAAGITDNLDNEIIGNILWWVIAVVLTVVILAVILIVSFVVVIIAAEVIKVWFKAAYKELLAVSLTGLGLITFCGDLIKRYIPINLILIFIIMFVSYHIAKYFIPWLVMLIARKIQQRR